jgi:hypothetical protein
MAAGRRQERSPGRRGVRLVQASRAAATAAAGVLPCAAALVLAGLIVPEREAAAGGSPEELDGPQALM